MKTAAFKPPALTEKQIQAAVIARLQSEGWIVIRVNSGTFKNTATGSFMRAYTICGLEKSAGFPDILALRLDESMAQGEFGNKDFCQSLLIEIKDAKGKLSESQIAFHGYAATRGVTVHVVRHPDELAAILGAEN